MQARFVTPEFAAQLAKHGLTPETWNLVCSNQMSISGKCMASAATPAGGRCWCCLPYQHEGLHHNPHAGLTWERDDMGDRLDEEIAKLEAEL